MTHSASAPALVAKGLTRSFEISGQKVEALRGVDLEVQEGEKVFLCGPSGAGKTTLLYTLAGLERPNQGQVMVKGQDVYAGSSASRASLRNTLMGYVFQSYFLLPELTALENVTLPSRIKGKPGAQRATELLERAGLGDRLHHLPYELSGGEQQRVAVARALINDPPFLFADEPTGNLDSSTGQGIMELLFSLASEKGKTLIVVTHDRRLASLGDRIVTLRNGAVSEE